MSITPAFIVAVEERVYVATPGDFLKMPWVQPDVFLVSTREPVSARAPSAVITPPLLIETLEKEQVRDHYLEILDAETREVVTTIEVLSPVKKAVGTSGRRKFMDKRRRILASRTHWIEIDLPRAGERSLEAYGRGDYYALLHRGEAGASFEVWVASLDKPLPVIAVPTRAPLPDTPLDLQLVVESFYRRGHYDVAINYDLPPPPPPMGSDTAQWIRERIAAWRIERPGAHA